MGIKKTRWIVTLTQAALKRDNPTSFSRPYMFRSLMKTVIINQTVIAFPFVLALYPIVKWRGIPEIRCTFRIYINNFQNYLVPDPYQSMLATGFRSSLFSELPEFHWVVVELFSQRGYSLYIEERTLTDNEGFEANWMQCEAFEKKFPIPRPLTRQRQNHRV